MNKHSPPIKKDFLKNNSNLVYIIYYKDRSK